MNRVARLAPKRRKIDRSKALRIAWMTDSHEKQSVSGNPAAPGASIGSRYFWATHDKVKHFAAQVNLDQPHGVMHTGDIVENDRDFAFFREAWDLLDPALPQAVVPGNHDFAFAPPSGSTRHDTMAADMDYASHPLIAGSKFNQSVVFSGNGVSARFIMLDTNISPTTGLHVASNTGYLSDDMLTWIQSELASSPQNLIFLCSHHGPHMWGAVNHDYFDTDDANALKDIVNAEVAARPNRKIQCLFGHHHIQRAVMKWNSLGTNLPGLLAPATVELNPSAYINLLITSDGKVGWEMRDTLYPYPAV